MDVGSFTSGLLTGLREGVEAALIVSIILAYLSRTGNGRYASRIWAGTGAAIAVSLGVGALLFATVGGLEPPAEKIFEGGAMLLAAAVVTWMLFWMRRQAVSARTELQAAVDRALSAGTVLGLVLLAFTAVIREGLETALFLVGLATSAESGAPSVLLGAVAGLGIAVLLGVGLYRGARLVDLRSFFRWTGIGLIFIAGGLLSHAVHEFVELGWISVGTQTAFDLSAVLPHEAGTGPEGLPLILGQFLRALLGYSATPELVTLAAWASYVVVILGLFLRPIARSARATSTANAGG